MVLSEQRLSAGPSNGFIPGLGSEGITQAEETSQESQFLIYDENMVVEPTSFNASSTPFLTMNTVEKECLPRKAFTEEHGTDLLRQSFDTHSTSLSRSVSSFFLPSTIDEHSDDWDCPLTMDANDDLDPDSAVGQLEVGREDAPVVDMPSMLLSETRGNHDLYGAKCVDGDIASTSSATSETKSLTQVGTAGCSGDWSFSESSSLSLVDDVRTYEPRRDPCTGLSRGLSTSEMNSSNSSLTRIGSRVGSSCGLRKVSSTQLISSRSVRKQVAVESSSDDKTRERLPQSKSSISLGGSPKSVMSPPKVQKKSALKRSVSEGNFLRRNVSFSKLEIREYPITLGDNPSVSEGPPISLGWEYKERKPICVEKYEKKRTINPRKSSKDLALSPTIRRTLLTNGGQGGICHKELDATMKTVGKIKRQRQVTRGCLPVLMLDEWRIELQEWLRRVLS